MKTYAKLLNLKSFEERLEYLMMYGTAGVETFGFDRWINQMFYRSPLWRQTRRFVIVRDRGLDLGMHGFDIYGQVIVHHMNPVTLQDLSQMTDAVIDPEYLISVSLETHNRIHYVRRAPLLRQDRRPGDTILWKKGDTNVRSKNF